MAQSMLVIYQGLNCCSSPAWHITKCVTPRGMWQTLWLNYVTCSFPGQDYGGVFITWETGLSNYCPTVILLLYHNAPPSTPHPSNLSYCNILEWVEIIIKLIFKVTITIWNMFDNNIFLICKTKLLNNFIQHIFAFIKLWFWDIILALG